MFQLHGTNGAQFHPDLEDNELVSAFISDFGRNAYMQYKQQSDSDSYPGLEIMKF